MPPGSPVAGVHVKTCFVILKTVILYCEIKFATKTYEVGITVTTNLILGGGGGGGEAKSLVSKEAPPWLGATCQIFFEFSPSRIAKTGLVKSFSEKY